VTKVSTKVLRAFSLSSESTGPRGIRSFVRSFECVQYGRVTSENLPKEWDKELDIAPDDLKQWRDLKMIT